jgi:hypothetical protein
MKVELRKRTKVCMRSYGFLNKAGWLKSMEMKEASAPKSFKRIAVSPTQPHNKRYGH